MAFPTTGILDNFNRADGSLGTNWVDAPWGLANALTITGNTVTSAAAAEGGDAWNLGTYGPDCEVYVTVSAINTERFSIYARMDRTGASQNGYYLRNRNDLAVCRIVRTDAGVDTQLGADIAISGGMAAGDSIGLEIIGSTLTAYLKRSAGSWASLATRTDSTYTAAGYLGLSCNVNTPITLDDFGGGTIATAAPPAYVPLKGKANFIYLRKNR